MSSSGLPPDFVSSFSVGGSFDVPDSTEGPSGHLHAARRVFSIPEKSSQLVVGSPGSPAGGTEGGNPFLVPKRIRIQTQLQSPALGALPSSGGDKDTDLLSTVIEDLDADPPGMFSTTAAGSSQPPQYNSGAPGPRHVVPVARCASFGDDHLHRVQPAPRTKGLSMDSGVPRRTGWMSPRAAADNSAVRQQVSPPFTADDKGHAASPSPPFLTHQSKSWSMATFGHGSGASPVDTHSGGASSVLPQSDSCWGRAVASPAAKCFVLVVLSWCAAAILFASLVAVIDSQLFTEGSGSRVPLFQDVAVDLSTMAGDVEALTSAALWTSRSVSAAASAMILDARTTAATETLQFETANCEWGAAVAFGSNSWQCRAQLRSNSSAVSSSAYWTRSVPNESTLCHGRSSYDLPLDTSLKRRMRIVELQNVASSAAPTQPCDAQLGDDERILATRMLPLYVGAADSAHPVPSVEFPSTMVTQRAAAVVSVYSMHRSDFAKLSCPVSPASAPIPLYNCDAGSSDAGRWCAQGLRLLVELLVATGLLLCVVMCAVRLLDPTEVLRSYFSVLDLVVKFASKFGHLAVLAPGETAGIAEAVEETQRANKKNFGRSQGDDACELAAALYALTVKQDEYRSYLPRGVIQRAKQSLQSALHRATSTTPSGQGAGSRAQSPAMFNFVTSIEARGAHNSPIGAAALSPRVASLNRRESLQIAAFEPVIDLQALTDTDPLKASENGGALGGNDEVDEDVNLNEYEDLLMSVGLPGSFAVAEAATALQNAMPSGAASMANSRGTSLAAGQVGNSTRLVENPFYVKNNAFLSPHMATGKRRMTTATHNNFSSVADFAFVSPNVAALHPPDSVAPVISIHGPIDTPPASSGSIGAQPPVISIDTGAQSLSGIDRGLPPLPLPPFRTPMQGSVVPSTSRRASSLVTTCLPTPMGAGAPTEFEHSGSFAVATGDMTGAAASPSPAHRVDEQHTTTALHSAVVMQPNHLAHSHARRASFVVCQLFFPSTVGAVSQKTCSGFAEKVSKDKLHTIELVSKTFLEIVTTVCHEFQGIIYQMSLSSVVLTFNAFEPCAFHESRACLCALHCAKELQETFDCDAATQLSGCWWGMCVNSGAAVVGVAGSTQKMAPVVVGDALTIARHASKLCPIIRAHVLVLEPCYNVSRTQIFCLPVDVVGQEGAQIIVFELKGRMNEYQRLVKDYQPLMDGFACMVVHKFEEAETLVASCLSVDHNAQRLLEFIRWARQVQGTGSCLLTKPYRRLLPLWDSPELLSEQEQLQDDVMEKVIQHRTLLASPPQANLNRPRLSFLADSMLRMQLDRQSVDMTTNQSPFGSADPWSQRTSVDVTPANDPSRKSSNSTGGNPTPLMDPLSISERAQLSLQIPVEITDKKSQTYLRTDRMLGQGSFGAVYQGLAAENGALVAMKILPLNASEIRAYRSSSMATMAPGARPSLPPHVEEVLKEVALLSQLVHPNVVQYITSTISNNFLMIVTEFMSGGNLSRMVQMFGRLPATVIRRYAKDILEGLKFLHSKNIVHRDINPNNVLLSLEGNCKISDFGAAASNLQRRGAEAVRQRRLSEETSASNKDSRSNSTDTTQFTPPNASPSGNILTPLRSGFGVTDGTKIVGTPIFMAPEACRGSASTASDIWGFGVIMCFCFSGQWPYPEHDYADVDAFLRRLALDETYGPIIPRDCITNAAALAMIEQCLRRREDQRPTAADLLMSPFLIM